MITDRVVTRLNAALSYAMRGFYVFPLYEPLASSCSCGDAECAHPAKHPRTPHGCLDATTEDAQIRAWWTRSPNANVGIATEPSGLIVLDVDPRHGGDESMRALKAEHTGLETLVALSGGGGEHYYFRATSAMASRTNALGSRYPGIDVRASGGYIIAPPSAHISGRSYEWEASSPNEPGDVPAWLTALLTKNEREPIAGADDDAPIVEGQRNATLARLAGQLRRHGMSAKAIEDALLAMNARQCVPQLPKHEVRAIATSIGRYPPTPNGIVGRGAQPQRPTFVRAATLLAKSDGDGLEYVVDGLLPVGGTAILAGRPKGGKSTLAANLSLSVVRGESFFGRATRRGPVLYVALEGAHGAWTQLLRDLGVTDADDLYFSIDRAPEQAIEWLRGAIEKYQPALVIVDTMQRLLRVKDGNDYATGSNATDAVIELARNAKVAHLMLHHSGKTRRGDLIDEVLGSTAWAAAVDTVLVMRKTERFRTLESQGRVGEDLAETVVEMDPVTRRVRAAGTKADSDLAEMRDAIQEYLRQYAEANPDDPAIDEPMIEKNVEGRNSTRRRALRELVAADRVGRIGSGKKGDPYRYAFSCTLVPDYGEEQENENPKMDERTRKIESDSCSRDSGEAASAGTRIPEGGSFNRPPDLVDELFAYANERISPSDDSRPCQTGLDL